MSISTALENLPEWTALGAGGGAGFFFIKWFFEWLGGRVDKREALVDHDFQRLDAGTQALIQHLQDQISSLIQRQASSDERIDGLRNDLEECRLKHSESEAKVRQLEATMLGMGDARQQVQRIVSEARSKDKE